MSYAYFCKMLAGQPQKSNVKGGFMSFGLEFDDYTLKYLQEISKDSIKNQQIKNNLRAGTLTTLPFSDDEALELAKVMRGKSWVNEQATKDNFLTHTTFANSIHLATHSILDDENPEQSALIFIKTKDSLDNLLRLEEIYALQLQADMIVLSACNTGIGKNQKGEGMSSLARAFNYAGIPSVTATLWSISDESSKKMMELYYGFLKEGMPKDIALQQAQMTYLQNDEVSSPAFRLPVYWAAWMPIGDTAAVSRPARDSYGWILLLLVALILGAVFWIKNRSTSL